MSTLVDLDTSHVLGVVDGRDSAAVGTWLAQRTAAWRERVEVVAIDPSAPFRKALRQWLPRAAVSVDKFHMVKLSNDTVTAVRQRLLRQHHGRRGRQTDTVWAHRTLLLRGADSLTPRGWDRLAEMFRRDDPTDELGAVWGIKEQLRRLLNAQRLSQAWDHRMRLGYCSQIADMAETTKLYDTVVVWWDAIEVLIVTDVTAQSSVAPESTEAMRLAVCPRNIRRQGQSHGDGHNRAGHPSPHRLRLSEAVITPATSQ